MVLQQGVAVTECRGKESADVRLGPSASGGDEWGGGQQWHAAVVAGAE